MTQQTFTEWLLEPIINKLDRIISNQMEQSTLFRKVINLIEAFTQCKVDLASCREQLAEALANDAADAQAIAEAQENAANARAAADEAQAALQPLQDQVAADTAEDAQLIALIDQAAPPPGEEVPFP